MSAPKMPLPITSMMAFTSFNCLSARSCLPARASLDGVTNKPLELEGVVATAGGNRAVSAHFHIRCHRKAETRVRVPLERATRFFLAFLPPGHRQITNRPRTSRRSLEATQAEI